MESKQVFTMEEVGQAMGRSARTVLRYAASCELDTQNDPENPRRLVTTADAIRRWRPEEADMILERLGVLDPSIGALFGHSCDKLDKGLLKAIIEATDLVGAAPEATGHGSTLQNGTQLSLVGAPTCSPRGFETRNRVAMKRRKKL